jgi:hypothetical protein
MQCMVHDNTYIQDAVNRRVNILHSTLTPQPHSCCNYPVNTHSGPNGPTVPRPHRKPEIQSPSPKVPKSKNDTSNIKISKYHGNINPWSYAIFDITYSYFV